MKPHRTTLKPLLLCLLILGILLPACRLSPVATPAMTNTATAVPATAEPGAPAPTSAWLQLYFTDPLAPSAKDYEGGPDAQLADAINSARLSVDVAAYSFNLWSIRDALIQAEKRGVVVRMVMESDNMDVPEVQELQDAGIPIRGDQRQGLMHDKFMVIDRAQVWTGSMNYTVGGTYRDNNNLLCIRSSQVAQNYTNEFEGMFTWNRFGPDRTPNTPYPQLTLDGTPVEILFSPGDGISRHLVDLLNGARESIQFMAYSFTSNAIGGAIIQKAQQGLQVSGVLDESQATQQGNEYDPFKQAGLDVRLDGNALGLLHHKVIIIDRQIVITGSYNFTASAENTNDENMVIIYNEDVAKAFMQEFQRVYDQAQQP